MSARPQAGRGGPPDVTAALPGVAFVLATTAGGTGAHVRSLAEGLAARGARVAVFGPAATQDAFGFTRAGAWFAPVEIADRPQPARDLAAVARLRRLARLVAPTPPGGMPAIVHAHGLRAGALAALALRGVAWRGRAGRPLLVVTLHNAPPVTGGVAAGVYAVLERIVAHRADRVLCVSGDLADRIRRRGARHTGRAIVPAPAAPAASPQAARAVRDRLEAGGRPLVLAVGRLAPQKGFATLLAAAGRLAGEPAPLVAIAGDGPQRPLLARQIQAQRLPVLLLGQRDDVPALLAAADVFVLPSLWEGQPLVLQEALRAGVPIVAARAGGIPDLTGQDAALLVPPGDAAALAAALGRVLADRGLAARLAAAAAQRGRRLPGEADAVEAVVGEYRAALRLAR